MLQAIRFAPGLEDVTSDCAFVVNGFAKRRRTSPSANGDLWCLIGQALGTGTPRVRKVKAHSTEEDLRIGLIGYVDYYRNAVAEALAGRGAICHSVPRV